MRSGKHKPARFSHYVRAHLNDLDGLVREGFVLAGDRTGSVEVIEDEDDVPHLGDVIREARDWYFHHLDELQKRGLA